MANNRVNNNDEIISFMNLEALVRVYFSREMHNTENNLRLYITDKIRDKLMQLDELRGYNFDIKASVEQFMTEKNDEYNAPLEPVDITPKNQLVDEEMPPLDITPEMEEEHRIKNS